MGLEALPLVSVGELQDADPAFPPAGDEQLPLRGHGEHSGAGVVAAESYRTDERNNLNSVVFVSAGNQKAFLVY